MAGQASLAYAAAAPADPLAILGALPAPVFVVDGQGAIAYANPAAEQFFQASFAALAGRRLDRLVPADNPLHGLIEQVRRGGHSVTQYGVNVEGPTLGAHVVTLGVAPMGEAGGTPNIGTPGGEVVVSIHELSMARKIDDQLTHRNAARSITAMAAMLAHEVKNPLSGIRGAAQLLEQGAAEPPGKTRAAKRAFVSEAVAAAP